MTAVQTVEPRVHNPTRLQVRAERGPVQPTPQPGCFIWIGQYLGQPRFGG